MKKTIAEGFSLMTLGAGAGGIEDLQPLFLDLSESLMVTGQKSLKRAVWGLDRLEEGCQGLTNAPGSDAQCAGAKGSGETLRHA